MASTPAEKISPAVLGVMPEPPAEFSPLATTASSRCCRRSSGTSVLTARRPGSPTMSPMNRIFTPPRVRGAEPGASTTNSTTCIRRSTFAGMFRPCIDLHEGKVKQIVGGTLTDDAAELRTNFVSERSAAWYAELYKRDGLKGGHMILLGPGNEEAARAALRVYPGGFQVGGGINSDNAKHWLDAGASHVIVTS